jgi:excisionase family DNA binding protein
MERLPRLEEAADLMGMKKSTLYSWLHRGQGPPVVKLPSGALRFRRQALEAWIKTHERRGPRAIPRRPAGTESDASAGDEDQAPGDRSPVDL